MQDVTQNARSGYTVILDDDPAVPLLVERALVVPSRGFDKVSSLLREAPTLTPVTAFIDIHLENESGLTAIPRLRECWPFCPLLVLTADESDEAVAQALDMGAHDVVLKPIRPAELKARVQARIKDQEEKAASLQRIWADLVLEIPHRRLAGPKASTYLSPTEVNLLSALMSAQGMTVPRSTLKMRCWGSVAVSDNALDRKIYLLRQALGHVGSRALLVTHYGVGFTLVVAEG